MSPSEFEFLIHLIGEKISKKDTVFRKAVSVQERLALTHSSTGLFISFPCTLLSNFVKMHWVLWAPYYFFSFIKFDKFYDTFPSPLHFTITKTLNKSHSTTDSHHSRQKHQEWKEGQRSGRWWPGKLHVQNCSGCNLIIPLMWRPNTDSTPNKTVTLPRNQLLIRYAVTSPVHTCNVTAYRNVVSGQCGRDSWLRKVSKVGYAVTLRACSVRCRYLAITSKGW